MKRFFRAVALVTMLLFAGCGTMTGGWYANKSDTDVNIHLIVHVDELSDSWPIVPDLVSGANQVLMFNGVRITHVTVKDDLIDVPVRATNRSEDHVPFYIYPEGDPSGIHVLVVDRIEDAHGNDSNTSGLFVRSRINRCATYIVVTDNAGLVTLAHELGHMFGLRHRTNIRHWENVMKTAESRGGRYKYARFDKRQLRKMSANARRHVDQCVR